MDELIDNDMLRLLLERSITRSHFERTHQRISEVGLHRFLKDYRNFGFIIISAFRTCAAEKGIDCDTHEELEQLKQNNLHDKELKQDLKHFGFGYIPVLGGYKEEIKDPETGKKIKVDAPSPERAYIVVARDSGNRQIEPEKLRQLGMTLAQKYKQESFLYKPPQAEDKNAYYVDGKGNITHTFTGAVKLNDLAQTYFTQLRKHKSKRFTFTEDGLNSIWIPKPPSGLQEAQSRYGEIFIRMDK